MKRYRNIITCALLLLGAPLLVAPVAAWHTHGAEGADTHASHEHHENSLPIEDEGCPTCDLAHTLVADLPSAISIEWTTPIIATIDVAADVQYGRQFTSSRARAPPLSFTN